MTNIPSWLGSLRDDERLGPALAWLSPEEGAHIRESWLSLWNQIPHDDDFHARCAGRLARCVPVAQGAVRRRRLGKQGSSLTLVYDPAEPDTAWLSLSDFMPSVAWAVAGATPAAIQQTLTFYTPDSDVPVGALPRQERLVKSLDIDDFEYIKTVIEKVELWVDDASWGSAFDDDPWGDLSPDAGMLDLSIRMRDALSQSHARRASFSYRTLWSRSVITVEQHPFGLWVFDVRYRPASDRRAVEMLAGSEPGARLPPDLPVDVAASLMRGGSLTHESLRAGEDAPWGPFEMAALCAIEPGEPLTVRRLREAIASWQGDERFQSLLRILDSYGYTSLLCEATSQVSDPTLLAELETLIAPALPQEEAP